MINRLLTHKCRVWQSRSNPRWWHYRCLEPRHLCRVGGAYTSWEKVLVSALAHRMIYGEDSPSAGWKSALARRM